MLDSYQMLGDRLNFSLLLSGAIALLTRVNYTSTLDWMYSS
ncbi:MAG: hypothetical protein WCA35_25475 [Kovacikia sp.]